jgi:DNA-binding NtrC family response regulator
VEGERILIVDDEQSLCAILSERLKKEGYHCVMANNVEEAVRYLERDYFSLIISDIKMPGVDGMKLLKAVKSIRPEVMLIIMTGYPEIDRAVEAIHLGVYDFIVKPFDLELMVLTVEKALKKRRLKR